jgi:hypothetical protein
MLTSIYLYHDSFFQAEKVYNIASQWLLPSEFVTVKLPEAQVAPKNTFGVGCVVSKFSGSRS